MREDPGVTGVWPDSAAAWGTAIIVAAVALLFGAAALGLAGRLRQRGVRTAYTRKVFHFLIFTGAAGAHTGFGFPGVLAFGGALTAVVLWAVLRGDGQAGYEALARPADAPHRTLFILVPLATTAAGGLLSNLLFGGYAVVGYLVAGWGDAVGEPVGARWGRHRYRVPSLRGVPATRSLEGSAAVLAASWAAAVVALLLLGHGPGRALAIGALAAAAAAMVEAVSTHGTDNLTTQVTAAAVAWLLA
jgi:phytol kinase